MTCVIFPVCGPAQKSRNWFRNLAAVAVFTTLVFPAAAQTSHITVTNLAPQADVASASDVVVTGEAQSSIASGPPRSIVVPYTGGAPRSRGPLTLLVEEPQSRQVASTAAASTPTEVVSDVVTPTPRRAPPAITVSTLSFPSTANN